MDSAGGAVAPCQQLRPGYFFFLEGSCAVLQHVDVGGGSGGGVRHSSTCTPQGNTVAAPRELHPLEKP